jgi:hypothetical protein
MYVRRLSHDSPPPPVSVWLNETAILSATARQPLRRGNYKIPRGTLVPGVGAAKFQPPPPVTVLVGF